MRTILVMIAFLAAGTMKAVRAAGPDDVRVDPPHFETPVDSLEEGFAYSGLLPPGSTILMDPPTNTASLPSLEEGFALSRLGS